MKIRKKKNILKKCVGGFNMKIENCNQLIDFINSMALFYMFEYRDSKVEIRKE